MKCIYKFDLTHLVQETFISPTLTFSVDVVNDEFHYFVSEQFSRIKTEYPTNFTDDNVLYIEPLNLKKGRYKHELIWVREGVSVLVFQGDLVFTDNPSQCKSCVKNLDVNLETIVNEIEIDFGERIIERITDKGKSAYELAVINGFEGTEQEWLDSLKMKYSELTEAEIEELRKPINDYVEEKDVEISKLINDAEEATAKTILATENAEQATQEAIQATANTNEAISNAVTATENAIEATENASESADFAMKQRGWSPYFVFENDGALRIVKKLADWIGGTGTKPTLNVGQYVLDNGYTTNKSLATNFKGREGVEAKPIDLSSPAPTADGVYIPTEVGTYSNYGNLSLSLAEKNNNITYFYRINGSFTTETKPISTANLVPYTGANKPIDFNIQSLTHEGSFVKLEGQLESKQLTGSTAIASHFRKYTDIASMSLPATATDNDIVITLPILGSTLWEMNLYLRTSSFSAILYLSAYGINNRDAMVRVLSGNGTANSVKFCRKGNRTVVIIKRNQASFYYGKVSISELYMGASYSEEHTKKSNYKIEFLKEEDIEGLVINTTILNKDFERDPFIISKIDNASAGITNNTLTNSQTSAQLSSLYPSADVGMVVKSITNNVKYIKETATQWSKQTLIIV